MRGSALRASGRALTPRAPRGLAGDRHPRAPRPEGALPLAGPPALRIRPLRIRAQGALLPETLAHKGIGSRDDPMPPLSPNPRQAVP